MNFKIQILGSNAALPTPKRFTTAQIINIYEEPFLIDCGEAVQIQLRKFKTNYGKINNIFISHLHGDHFFGLFGLISSFNLSGRTKDLNIYADENIKNFFYGNYPLINADNLSFKIIFHKLTNEKKIIFENKYLKIIAFPLIHDIPTHGFFFIEKKRPPNIIKQKIVELKLTIEQIKKLKKQQDIEINGKKYKYTELTVESFKPRTYLFISDTVFMPQLSEQFSDIDLLYHEATFLKEDENLAALSHHSTTEQAARMANLLNAKKLLIGHFSTRYKNENLFLEQAKKIFPETILAADGLTIEIDEEHKFNVVQA